MPSTNKNRRTISMRQVENGFTVNVSYSTEKDYVDKTYIAKNEVEAKKLANKFL